MIQEKITRQELRDMKVGQTRVIELASPKKLESARQTVRQVAFEDGMEFSFVPDKEHIAVSITRTN